jgi:hypothetical protein
LRWLNIVIGVNLVQFSLLLFSQQGLGHIPSGISPYFPLAGGLCKLYANAEENKQYSANYS